MTIGGISMKNATFPLRRLLALVLVLVMVGSVFAGCSKNKPEETEPQNPVIEQTDAPTEEPTEAPTEEPTEAPTEPEVTVPPVTMGTVNADNLNVRSDPYSTADILKRLAINTRIEILEQKIVDGVKWGRIAEGWLNLNYVTIDGEGTTPGTNVDNVVDNNNALTGGTVQDGNGTITATELHIRESADANSKSLGTYKKGDKVTVLERNGDWGRVQYSGSKSGWINLKHVSLTGTVPTSSGSGATNTGSSSTGSTSTSSSTPVSNGNKTVLGTGTVKDTSTLAVRVGPGTQYEMKSFISKGETVEYFQKSNGWVRIKNGWVNADYLELEYAIDPGTEGTVNTGELNVREKPDAESESLTTIQKGDDVTILEVDGIWGRIEYEAGEYGWINLDYIKFPSSVTSSYTTGNGVVSAEALNYREEPNAESKSLGTYKKGDEIEITDVDGNWGKTSKGWVNLKYVDMDPVYGTGTAKVTASSLNIRAKASATSDDLGTLKKGTKVTILEVDGSWGKIEYKTGKYGWISMKYVEMVAGDKHKVTIAGSANGTVKAGATKFAAGTTVTLTVSPESGYQLDKLVVKDDDGTNVAVSNYKFVMPNSDVTVTATFKKATSKYTVTVNTSKYGKVSASTTSCYPGTEVALSVAPKSGYVLDTLTAMNTTDNTTVTVSNGQFTMPEGNVNVVATFKEAATTYSVATSTSSYGKIIANTTAAEVGDTITLTIQPNSGYELDELTVKNATTNDTIPTSGSDNTYTFTMPASKVTVSATYKTAKYTVTIISPAHGSISVNPDTYAKGAKVTLVVTPDEGYELDKMTFTNTEDYTTAISGKTFTMPGDDVYVEASFKKIKYEINIYKPANGKITADKEKHGINETVTLTISPESGYVLESMTVKNATTGEHITVSGSGNTRTFTMPASKVNISSKFKVAPTTYTVSVGSISNGTVTADKASAAAGETVSLTVTPASGYELDTLTVNGTAITGTTFTMPAANATIAATFKAVRTITVTAKDTAGNPVSGASIKLMYVDGGLKDISGCSAKTTGSDGKVTFTAADLANVTNGMKLVAEITGNHEWAPPHPVRVGSAGNGLNLTNDADGNAYLTATVATDAPLSGNFTITVKEK